ncbi:MAG TPA: hypothetical protein VJW23_17860, partial [Propionibacteriaceae bacterium]|nr:hypothetical protein [Propionibacteriaceae bacterium]
AGGGSTILGKTDWGSGWQVTTALNQYHGCFITEISARDFSIHGDYVATNTPKEALLAHRQAVETVMKLGKFHGREASPKEDVQVMLEPVGAR